MQPIDAVELGGKEEDEGVNRWLVKVISGAHNTGHLLHRAKGFCLSVCVLAIGQAKMFVFCVSSWQKQQRTCATRSLQIETFIAFNLDEFESAR